MDEAELRAWLAEYHADAFGWALSCCRGNVHEAADCLQSAYLEVLRGRARFEGRSSFKTWLFAVIRRVAAGERRKAWWRRHLLAGHVDRTKTDRDGAGENPEPFRAEEGTALTEALAALSSRQRELLHLVFYQELTIEKAAEILGISLGSARTHYERGKVALRRRLAAPGEGSTDEKF